MKKLIFPFLIILIFSEPLSAKYRSHTLLSFHLGFARAAQRSPRLSSGIDLNFDMPLTRSMHFNLMPTFSFRGYSGSTTVKARYLDLPFNIEFSGNKNQTTGFFGFGGYIGLAIKGKYKDTYYTDWKKMNFGESTADNRSNLDGGLLFNVGMMAPVDKGIMKFGLQYMVGLKNVVPKDRQLTAADEIKLRNFTCYLAVSIFNKRK